jgi:hypothetical protein
MLNELCTLTTANGRRVCIVEDMVGAVQLSRPVDPDVESAPGSWFQPLSL